MNTIAFTSESNDGLFHRHSWTEAMENRYGLHCRFHAMHSGDSVVRQWHAGQMAISDAELAWQCLSPVMHQSPSWNGDHLLFKLVRSGSLTIEQSGETHRFGKGSVILVDPLRPFSEYFREATHVTVLRMPKQALRERGVRHGLQGVYAPDLASPDVRAVRDYVSFTAQQGDAVSERMRERLGNQCLDVMDVMFNEAARSTRAGNGAATVLRAKQVIARLVADPGLSVARIASELGVSANYLNRAFRAEGLSPMRHVWSLRLELAARLLASMPKGGIRAKEIAYQCGFATPSHFSRAFKERYDISPLAFATSRGAPDNGDVFRGDNAP